MKTTASTEAFTLEGVVIEELESRLEMTHQIVCEPIYDQSGIGTRCYFPVHY
jgi:hypothetical protein